MSISNLEKVVTKQNLKDFYNTILPYLGDTADARAQIKGRINHA